MNGPMPLMLKRSYFREVCSNSVWEQTELYHKPLQQVESVPHPHFEDIHDVFLSPNIFWSCARISTLHQFSTCLPVGITTSYTAISPPILRIPMRMAYNAFNYHCDSDVVLYMNPPW